MPGMTDQTATSELARALAVTTDLYGALHALLGESVEIDSRRTFLTQGTIGIVIEHGVSIVSLVHDDRLASASVLLRAQFEALVRALWLHYSADDDWIEKYFATVQAQPGKDPNMSRGMDEMLQDIAGKAPAALARMLLPLKAGAWGPLNSYVHAGIHPVVHQHLGVSDEFALATLRNSNGLTCMAATLTAILTGNRDQQRNVIAAQRAHADCLPPLDPDRPPPATSSAT